MSSRRGATYPSNSSAQPTKGSPHTLSPDAERNALAMELKAQIQDLKGLIPRVHCSANHAQDLAILEKYLADVEYYCTHIIPAISALPPLQNIRNELRKIDVRYSINSRASLDQHVSPEYIMTHRVGLNSYGNQPPSHPSLTVPVPEGSNSPGLVTTLKKKTSKFFKGQ